MITSPIEHRLVYKNMKLVHIANTHHGPLIAFSSFFFVSISRHNISITRFSRQMHVNLIAVAFLDRQIFYHQSTRTICSQNRLCELKQAVFVHHVYCSGTRESELDLLYIMLALSCVYFGICGMSCYKSSLFLLTKPFYGCCVCRWITRQQVRRGVPASAPVGAMFRVSLADILQTLYGRLLVEDTPGNKPAASNMLEFSIKYGKNTFL